MGGSCALLCVLSAYAAQNASKSAWPRLVIGAQNDGGSFAHV